MTICHMEATLIIYTDLDNTLLGQGGSLLKDGAGNWSAAVAIALTNLLSSGFEIVPVSGRTVAQMSEICRLLGVTRFIAEMGAFICTRGVEAGVVENFTMPRTPGRSSYKAINQSGAVDFLLEKYRGRLEYHEPWSRGRDCTHLFRGGVDAQEANRGLASKGFSHLEMLDNGAVRNPGNLIDVDRPHAYHLVPAGVSKGSAIGADLKARNHSTNDSVAIGDSVSDLEMADFVRTLYLVADPDTAPAALLSAAAAKLNVVVAGKPGPEGWTIAINQLTGASAELK